MATPALRQRMNVTLNRLLSSLKPLHWDEQAILSRSYFVLALGFGTLIALIAILSVGAIRRAQGIYSEMESTQDAYLQAESFRRDIATDMYLADILVRDYLLDPSPQNAPLHRQQLLEIRSSLQTRLDQLAATTTTDSDSPGWSDCKMWSRATGIRSIPFLIGPPRKRHKKAGTSCGTTCCPAARQWWIWPVRWPS